MKQARMVIDCLMVVLLPVLMAYSLVGEAAHEWLGIGMALLFLGHHALNWRWYRSLTRDRWNAARMWQTVVDTALLAAMLGLIVNGPILSRHALTALPIHGGRSFARILHMLSAYWGFCLVSLHLGMHWSMVLALLQKKYRLPALLLRAAAILAAGYGVYAFIRRGIGTYLFLRNSYVFFDFEEPLILFFLDYLAVMVLFAVIGFYTSRLIRHRPND